MKIELKDNYVAILREESGEIVGVFRNGLYANEDIMCAVASHYDVAMVGMNTDRDYDMWDYDVPYDFVLYVGEEGNEEYVTLKMTYAPIY